VPSRSNDITGLALDALRQHTAKSSHVAEVSQFFFSLCNGDHIREQAPVADGTAKPAFEVRNRVEERSPLFRVIPRVRKSNRPDIDGVVSPIGQTICASIQWCCAYSRVTFSRNSGFYRSEAFCLPNYLPVARVRFDSMG
jgi:hypothetical protein